MIKNRVKNRCSLGVQLHLSTESTLTPTVRPVKNDRLTSLRNKPANETGLWTSTWRKKTRDSEWAEYAEDVWGTTDEQCWFLLTPDPGAHLCVIDSSQALALLIERYPLEYPGWLTRLPGSFLSPLEFTGIDFEQMSLEYDGLHLTHQASVRLHLSFPLNMNSWDCESTIWFRWCFKQVRQITPQTPGTPSPRPAIVPRR